MQKQNITDIPISYILDENFDSIDENKEYTTDDLQVGMKVHYRQLLGIHNTWILMANPIDAVLDSDVATAVGTVVYIGKRDKNFERAYEKYTVGNKRPMIIFNAADSELFEPLGENI